MLRSPYRISVLQVTILSEIIAVRFSNLDSRKKPLFFLGINYKKKKKKAPWNTTFGPKCSRLGDTQFQVILKALTCLRGDTGVYFNVTFKTWID